MTPTRSGSSPGHEARGRPASRRLPWRGALAALLLAGCGGAKEPTPAPTATPEPAQVLLPGEFLSPLTRLQRIEGEKTHLHVDEVRYRASDKKLFQCSYTFGVLDAKDPANMSYTTQNIKHVIPEDKRTPGCIHLAYDGDIVYTTHRGNISNPTFVTGWNIAAKDPDDETKTKAAQIPVLQEPGVSYEGIDVADGTVFVALKNQGLGVYKRDLETNALSRIGSLEGIGNTWGLRAVGKTVFLSDMDGNLVSVDVTDPTQPRLASKVEVGGVPRGIEVGDGMVFVAAGSEGLVVVDAKDPANLTVLGRAATPGTSIRVGYSEGHAVVADWNDTRVYDVSDPTQPRFVGATRQTQQATYGPGAGDLEVGRPPVTVRTLGVAMDKDIVFVGNWWVLYTYRLHADRLAPNIRLAEDANTVDFGEVAAGESKTVPFEVTNQGTAPLTLFNNWAEGDAFTVEPKQVQVPPGESTVLQVTYRADTRTDKPAAPDVAAAAPTTDDLNQAAVEAGDDPAFSNLHIWSDDPEFPVRTAILVANRPGLGIGRALPETKVALLDGGAWSSADQTGNVKVLAYFATF